MTLLIASVSGPQEAMIALDAGADIIDLHDPAGGPLGAPSPALLRTTVAAVAGRRRVSAAAGTLATGGTPDAALALAATGVDYVRIGLPAAPDPAALGTLAARTRLVVALFAGADPALLPALAAAGVHATMLDTEAGRLLDRLDLPALGRFVAAARQAGLRAGLGGNLEAPDVPRLLLLQPDLLGGCLPKRPGGRSLDATLRRLRALVPAAGYAEPAQSDSRHRAPRASPPEADPPATDRIFVHDFILPVRIGAYAAEHAAPQRVRFDVEALVTRGARPAREMADVFSYDLITDGIRLLVAGGHFQLVETLAERIAAVVLAHRRVRKVTVRVTKLETGSGAMGVEIERARAPAPAAADILPLAQRPRS